MSSTRSTILHRMGVVEWRSRGRLSQPAMVDSGAAPVVVDDPAAVDAGDARNPPPVEPVTPAREEGGLDALELQVADCRACELADTRTHTVFGVGNPRAAWMLVGEAPGAEEDRRGEPFVGRAGQLLNAMLAAAGRSRDEVYIANVLKCRPPNNRDPLGEEVVQCAPYLHRQIRLVQPALIIALGRFAAQALLKTHDPIGKLRGRVHRHPETGVPLVVTYHPAYLLRSPLEKRKAWQDLKMAIAAGSEDGGSG